MLGFCKKSPVPTPGDAVHNALYFSEQALELSAPLTPLINLYIHTGLIVTR
jgi:hypothetical protein